LSNRDFANVGAYDVAFAYLNGSIVCDLGGVHGDSPGSCTFDTLTAGGHTLELFYADIEQTGAALTFASPPRGISGAPPVPEPASLVLLGPGRRPWCGSPPPPVINAPRSARPPDGPCISAADQPHKPVRARTGGA
jgi:hypothetical protein